MARMLRMLCAIITIASFVFAPAASAQQSPIRVEFANTTPYCVWVTLYQKDNGGIFGTAASPHIVKTYADSIPRWVQPHSHFTFRIPRERWLRLRTELTNGCKGGVVHDLDITYDDLHHFDVARYQLVNGNGKPYLVRN